MPDETSGEALPSPEEFASPPEDSEETRALRTENASLRKRLRALRGGEALIVRAVQESYADPPDLTVPAPPKQPKRKAEEIALLHVTDWQLGKLTESYSVAVAAKRIAQLAEKTVRITETRRSAASIDEIVVLVGGDIVEGESVFPHQAHEIEQSVFEQSVKSAPAILTRLLLALLRTFKRVRVHCVCGNHGDPPRRLGQHPKTNWDRVAYEVARVALLGAEDSPRKELASRLELHIAEAWYAPFNVYDWGGILIHGHEVKGGFAGFPWYGVGRRAWGWIDAIDEPWEHIYLGHFHQHVSACLNRRIFYATGSPESDNVFAQQHLAAAGWPSQRLQFFDREWGVIADHQILLTEPGERLPQKVRQGA